ncbi:MAG TPA: FkbM family methyltransferase [Puia sp.]
MAIKKILLKVLGEKKYLSLLANSFQPLFRTGMLGKEYQDVYFLKKIIRPGDWCVDIGAHLGYFTLELSQLTGDKGKVFAIEPMSTFHSVLEHLLQTKKATNVTLYKLALGGDGEYVEMGIPRVGNAKRFAHARLKEASPTLDFVESEKVKNTSGDQLFSDLSRLDYIKCDVEGLEYKVFSTFLRTLEKHHPILLCELFDRDQRIQLFELLKPLGYRIYGLGQGHLVPIDVYAPGQIPSQNDYFIHPQNEEKVRAYIKG